MPLYRYLKLHSGPIQDANKSLMTVFAGQTESLGHGVL